MITIEELKKKHEQIYKEALALVVQRGKEYATGFDTLKTFREVGIEIGTRPSMIAAVLLSIKHKRILEQLRHEKDIKDSVRDLINYAIYIEVLLEEELSKK